VTREVTLILRSPQACWRLTAALLAVAAILPYLPFLPLPAISDDYLQIGYSRQYVPRAHWDQFASDALYRCRATSLVVTYWLDQVFGMNPLAHRTANVAVHVLNVLLVACLGVWRRIGWRISVPAALFFAMREGHQEAVVWSAALHELLVFLFGVLALLAWLRWLQRRTAAWLAAFLVLFVLSLASKESAVVLPALACIIWWWEARAARAALVVVAGCLAIVGLYTLATFQHPATHLHLNDGSFSLKAPFVSTVLFSLWRLLFPWGLIAGAAVLWRNPAFALSSLAFSVVTLLPYSFLIYMDRVPSRHTYWAGLGASLLLGAAAAMMWDAGGPRMRYLCILLAVVFALHNTLYLWTKKLDQYQARAEPTEQFVRFAGVSGPPVAIRCGPYRVEVFEYAARLRLQWRPGLVLPPGEATPVPAAHDFCYQKGQEDAR
jgi:hypothetical protein